MKKDILKKLDSIKDEKKHLAIQKSLKDKESKEILKSLIALFKNPAWRASSRDINEKPSAKRGFCFFKFLEISL